MDITYYAKTLAAYGGYLAAFAVGGLSLYWAGLPDGVHRMVIGAGVVILADMISGSLVALKEKRFSSGGAKGSLIKLATYCSALLLGYGVDTAHSMGSVCVAAMITVIFVVEATSVVENLGKLGMRVPPIIKEWIDGRRGKQEAKSQ